jgi:hypothetical protein
VFLLPAVDFFRYLSLFLVYFFSLRDPFSHRLKRIVKETRILSPLAARILPVDAVVCSLLCRRRSLLSFFFLLRCVFR